MPPNVFKIRETGDIVTFKNGVPKLLQLGTLGQQVPGENFGAKLPGIHSLIKEKTGIDINSIPAMSVEDISQKFTGFRDPNTFFGKAQSASLEDFITGRESIPQAPTPQQPQGAETKTFTTPSGVQVQAPQLKTQPQALDPKIQKAQQEIQKAQELQARVNQMLIKQGKQPVPIPGQGSQAPQTSQNAPGSTQTPETTPPTSQGIQPQLQAPEPSLADEIKGIFSQLGISMPSQNQSPVTSAADVYKQFAEQTNLFGLKKDMQDLTNKKTQEITDVNENPWISEGLRSKKITNIENKYQARIDALQSTFNRADEDARFLTGKYLEQVHQTQQRTDDFLFKAVDLAERELSGRRAERKFETQQALAESRQTQQERQFQEREERLERQKGSGKKVSSGSLTITSGDIGEGATVLEKSRGRDGNADTTTYLKMLKHWTNQGGLIQDFFKHYPPKDYLNPGDSLLKEYPSIKRQLKDTSGTLTIE